MVLLFIRLQLQRRDFDENLGRFHNQGAQDAFQDSLGDFSPTPE